MAEGGIYAKQVLPCTCLIRALPISESGSELVLVAADGRLVLATVNPSTLFVGISGGGGGYSLPLFCQVYDAVTIPVAIAIPVPVPVPVPVAPAVHNICRIPSLVAFVGDSGFLSLVSVLLTSPSATAKPPFTLIQNIKINSNSSNSSSSGSSTTTPCRILASSSSAGGCISVSAFELYSHLYLFSKESSIESSATTSTLPLLSPCPIIINHNDFISRTTGSGSASTSSGSCIVWLTGFLDCVYKSTTSNTAAVAHNHNYNINVVRSQSSSSSSSSAIPVPAGRQVQPHPSFNPSAAASASSFSHPNASSSYSSSSYSSINNNTTDDSIYFCAVVSTTTAITIKSSSPNIHFLLQIYKVNPTTRAVRRCNSLPLPGTGTPVHLITPIDDHGRFCLVTDSDIKIIQFKALDESIKVIHVISLPPGGANGGSGSSSSTGYPTSSKSGGGGGGGIHHQHVPSPPYIFSAYTQTKLHLYLCAENNGGIWRVSKKDLCAKYPTPSLSYLGKRMSGGGGSGGGNVAHMVPIHHSRGSGTGSSSSSGSGFLMDTLALFGDFCDGEVLNISSSSPTSTTVTLNKLQTLPNIAPVIDFKMADVGREGKDTLFLTSNLSPSSPFPSSSSATTATSGSALGLLIGGGSGGGGSASGSIRELKNGITVKVDASSTDFTGVTGIFPIRYLHPDSRSSRQRRLGFIDVNEIDDEGDSQDDTFLAVSFIGETKIMYLNQEDRDTATKVNRNSYNGGGSGSAAGALLEDVSDRFGIIMGEESLLVCSMIISSSSESLASSSSSSKNTTSIMEDSNYDDIKLDDLTPSTAISSSASPPPAPFTMAVAQICRSGIFFTRQHFDETTPTTSSILQQQPRGVDYEYDHGDIVGEYKPLHGGRIELVALETDNTRLFISVNNSNNTNPSLTSSSSPYQIIIVKLAHQQHQPHLVNTLEDGIERPSLSSSSCGSSISGGRVDVIELMRLDCLNEPSAFLPLPKYLISSLSSRQEGDSDVLVVGTYASTIHVVRCLDGGVLYDGTILQKDGSANNTTAAAAAEFLDQGTDIVHSLCQITSTGGIGNAEEDNGADGCGVMFLAGLRDGIVRLYQWSNMDQRLVCLDSMKLGCLPVQFTAPHPLNRHQREPASPLPPSYLLAFSDRSWKLIIRHHTITAIALNFPPVHLAAPFSFNSTHHHSKSTLKMSSAHYCDTFMFVANDHLHFVRVNLDKTLDFRIKLIHETPRRLLFDPATGKFIVSTVYRSPGLGLGSVFCSDIKVIDPISGKTLLRETLPRGETCVCMSIWNVKENKRYICIGTAGFTDTSPEKAQGRVLVYNLKSSSDKGGGGGGMSVTSPRGDEDFSFFATATTSSAANAVGGNSNYSSSSSSTRNTSYKMRRLGEFHMQSPVYQVVPFMTSYLLAASGKTLSIIKIDAQTRILVSNTQYQMRWEIRSVSTFENRIVVGCQRDSLSFFDYDALNKKFEYLGSDQCSRLVNDSMIVSPQFAVGTDKAGNFFGLSCRHPLDAANPAVAAAAEAEMMGAEGGSSDNNGSGTGLSNVVQSPLAPPTTSKLTTAVPLDNNLVTEFSYNVGQAIVRLHRGNLAHVVESADGVFESMMMSTVSSNSNAGVRSHDPPSFTDSNNAAASDASGDDALFASLLSIRPEELNLGWRGAATMQPVNPLRAHQPLAITGINGSQMDLDIGISPATPILSSPPQQHPTHRASLSSPVFLSPGGQASSDPFSPIAAFSPPSAGSGMQMGSSPWSFQPVAESIAHNVLPFSRVDNETIVTSAATTRSPKSISSSIIYGSTMLGSVFAFIQIGADALVKLRLLQHILAIDPATRPLLGNDHAAFRSNRNCYQTTEISSTLSSKTAATGRTLNGQSSKSGGGGGGSGWKRSSEVHQQQQLLLDETGAVLDGELLTMFVGLGLETQLGIARKWVDLATGKNGDNNNNININSTTNKTTTSSLFAKLKPSIGKENDLLYRSRIEAARRMLVLTIEHLNKKCI